MTTTHFTPYSLEVLDLAKEDLQHPFLAADDYVAATIVDAGPDHVVAVPAGAPRWPGWVVRLLWPLLRPWIELGRYRGYILGRSDEAYQLTESNERFRHDGSGPRDLVTYHRSLGSRVLPPVR